MTAQEGWLILAIDTATRESIVALGALSQDEARDHADAAPAASLGTGVIAECRRTVQHRHGSQLLAQIEEVMSSAATSLDAVGAVAVGTGPGSFTGLRVGLATAKTLAHVRGLPLVGVPTSDALRRAAVSAGAPDRSVVVLPAGAHDQYLARDGRPAELIAPGALDDALGTDLAIAVDLEVLGGDATVRGRAAVEGLSVALLSLARERLSEGEADDPAQLVPAYVALPRGVRSAVGEMPWSPDLR